MAKGKAAKGPKPSPAQAKKQGAGKPDAKQGADEALRRAVAELGGDDSDLQLIAGVDSDDEGDVVAGKTAASDEKDLQKALGAFMKGLDFKSVAPQVDDDDDEEEDEEAEEEEEDEEDEDEDDDDDDDEEEEEEEEEEVEEEEDEEDEEDEEEDEEDESDEASAPAPAPKPKAASPAKKEDPDPKSGRSVPLTSSWPSLVPELSAHERPLGKAPAHVVNNLKQRAERLLEELPKPQRAGSSSDAAFISQILSGGTHQDKLSALILLVRESPIHAISELERLRSMAGWRDGAPGSGGGRDQRMATVRALADWWVSGGGKEAGKLRYFADQPLLAHTEITDRHLVVYAFEDYLKKWFFSVLQILEVLSHDTLPYVRAKALDVTFQLLAGNAEQEQNLLRLGVNKLGDTDRSVASKASYNLLQLLQAHPAMKAVVAREVSAIILKTTITGAAGSANAGSHQRFDDEPVKKGETAKTAINDHGRYYGLITLNQMTLTSKDKDVAGRLVEVYFEVFREILGDEQKKGEEEKLDAAADEFDADKLEKVTGKVEKWRGRRKGAKPKGGHKAAADAEELIESAAAKVISAVLTGINRSLPFAKLDDELFSGYMETLFKICHAGTFNTSIQALQLIFQVSQSRSAVQDRFYRTLYESLFDNRLLTSSKQAMYLNLLFKALKADTSLPRVMAFVKRLLQMLTMHQPPFICGALYLLGELFVSTPGLRRMLIEPEDDDETAQTTSTDYDGKKRDPQYAHADSSCLWELVPFLEHFHPSVALQANQLLMGQQLSGSPDISLNTLISFLDKFVYRNPKKSAAAKGASIMQPAAVTDHTGTVIRMRGPRTGEDAFVNSEAFWRKKVEDVPVDQLFFHKFFSAKLARKDGKKSKVAEEDESDGEISGEEMPSSIADEDSDEEEPGSDPEEDEVWKAMKASMPDVGDDLGISDDSSDGEVEYSSDEEEGEDEDEGDEDEDEGVDDDEDEDEDEEGVEDEDDDSESDGDFPNFDDDEDDLIPLDEMPEEVLGGSEPEEEEEEDEIAGAKRKRKEERKERKKKRREMPAFASYEDYAALIEQGGDDEDMDE